MRPAAFLDRDGTLIRDRGYICSFHQVRIFPFAAEALRRLRAAGVATVLVTNQSAVARGICTPEQIRALHNRLRETLARESALIDAVYWCPFHPRGRVPEFTVDSEMRKPRPGMLLQAARELDLDLSSSLMVGDKPADIAAGNAAGCTTALVRTGYGAEAEMSTAWSPGPDMVGDDLLDIVRRWLDSR